jgi:D-alanyl-D-alanine carboxypeptidase/D-alanyl-D-alanine-endopeptidase (penicillin-binding protein 4)
MFYLLRKYINPTCILLINCIILFLLPGCSRQVRLPAEQQGGSRPETLVQKINYLISDPELFNAQIGVYIESVDRGDVLFALNEHKVFIPASNMKLFTTASALLRFGPAFRFQTGIYAGGAVRKNILEGNLIIKGSGDPSLAPRFSDGDSRKFFRSWADSLKARGISKINGNIVGDASYFQANALGYGWQWDDEPYWYSAQISALCFNDNCVDVTVQAGEQIGAKPSVTLSPPTSYVSVENNAVTTAPDSNRTLFLTRPRQQNIISISNEIPVNKPRYTESISVEDPAQFFVHVLKEILEEEGIEVSGEPLTVTEPSAIDYTSLTALFIHQSPPLSEIIAAVNKPSQNLYAEQLLIKQAAEFGAAATAAEGARVVNATLAGMGVTASEFLMHDGSGLSRMNLISPNSVAHLLRYMAKSVYAACFMESLPVAGVDGSLRRRMKDTPAQGKIWAKTGFVGHVRNLSGYAQSADGEMFLFSILVNNYLVPTPSINLLQDRICVLLANFKR